MYFFFFTQTFYFDPRGIHWPSYIENYLIGTKKFLLNEDLHGVPAARQHLKILRNIRWSTNLVIAVMLWRLLIAKSQPATNLWFFVLSLAARFVRFFRISSTVIKHQFNNYSIEENESENCSYIFTLFICSLPFLFNK